jgi:hypothetical protein
VATLFIAVFMVVWLTIPLVISLFGWRELAGAYRARQPFTGPKWRWRTGYLGPVRYKLALTIGADSSGLHVAMAAPLRIGHPPLSIPWTDVTIVRVRGAFGSLLEFRFSRCAVRLQVSGSMQGRLAAAATESWPGVAGAVDR